VVLKARSYALVQLCWSAESKLRAALACASDLPNASAQATELVDVWLKSSACPLYGTLVVDAVPIHRPRCFLVLRYDKYVYCIVLQIVVPCVADYVAMRCSALQTGFLVLRYARKQRGLFCTGPFRVCICLF